MNEVKNLNMAFFVYDGPDGKEYRVKQEFVPSLSNILNILQGLTEEELKNLLSRVGAYQ